jgi:hypothetical protein
MSMLPKHFQKASAEQANHNDSQSAAISRRQLLLQAGTGLGPIALSCLLNDSLRADSSSSLNSQRQFHFAPRAKSVIYLTMSGGPSQLDLFDPKPKLIEHHDSEIPQEFVAEDKFAFIRGKKRLLGSPYRFARHGESGAEVSELLPHLTEVVDDLAIVRSMTTDSFNHDPALLMLNTGGPLPGRPSMGSWITYGLGSESRNLPSFVVLVSGKGQPVGAHAWDSGFLPTIYQGVQFRSSGEPVLFLSDPPSISRASRRKSLDTLRSLNEIEGVRVGDPEIATCIAAYELAYRMQTSVPELMDFAGETAATHALYGSNPDGSNPDGADPARSTFAGQCLLARRLVERGVRFVQLYHRDWDHHGIGDTGGIDLALPARCREIDQPVTALIKDLSQRGLLDETLVIWGGEFGRTPIREVTDKTKHIGRDHHPHAFTIWMAGGGIKPGLAYGSTDELGYHAVENRVHVHDLQATILHCLGLDHTRLTYQHQGRDYRLTDVGGRVVSEILA